jgi:hypothetical protein
MLTAIVEKFKGDFSEIRHLLNIHYKELALNQDKVPLDPQWDLYQRYEDAGNLVYVTLRDAGELIGYVIAIVAPGLHYKTCLTATMDILFVNPEKRDKASKGVFMLVDTLEVELRRRGVQRWFMGTKLHKDIGAIFKRRKFVPVEMTYTKWLGD